MAELEEGITEYERIKGVEQKTTFMQEDKPDSGKRIASGRTLRREYLYNERAKFLLTQAPDYVFTEQDEKDYYPGWQLAAEKEYPDEGDYEVDKVTKEATFLGLL